MKKLALLLITAVAFTSCDIDDDGPVIQDSLAIVTEIDLPEYFEEGEKYEIDVIYKLPNACHNPYGLAIQRGGQAGDEYRDIYIAGVSTYVVGQANCEEEEEEGEAEEDDEDLFVEDSFSITINKDEPFTFYLWTGIDEDGENQHTVYEVPVGEPEPSEPEEEEEEEA